MFEPLLLAAIAGTFLLAGAVKGVIGLGLPTVSLALLTVILDLPTAMVLLLLPSFVTNLWQAVVGGHWRALISRLWPFFIAAAVTVWLGSFALRQLDIDLLVVLLGFLLVSYGTISLLGRQLSLTARQGLWAGPFIGVINGVLTGMTGSFVVPGVMYLQALGLSRDALVQAMGMLFTLSTAALAVALQGQRFLTVDLGLVSAVALIPAMIGMAAGQRLRQRLSEQLFRQIFFWALIVLGLYIIAASGNRMITDLVG